MVEHGTENAGVDSSSLSLGTTPTPYPLTLSLSKDAPRRSREGGNLASAQTPFTPSPPQPDPLTLSRSKGAPHLDNPRPLMFQ